MFDNKYLQIRHIWKALFELEQLADESGADEDVMEGIFLIRQDVLQLSKDILEDMTARQLEKLDIEEYRV